MSASSCTNEQSLVISPNLEALLEHDARMRRMKSGASSSWSTNSAGSVEPVVQSLPPPPRRRKIAVSPKNEYREGRRASGTTDASSLPATPSSSTSIPNPYVNPSPSFESVSDEQPEKKQEIRNEEKLVRVPPRSSSIPHSPAEEDTEFGRWKQFKMLKNAIGVSSLQERAQRKGKLSKLKSETGGHSRVRSASSGSLIEVCTDQSRPAKPPIPTSPKPDFRSSPLLLRRMQQPPDDANLLDAAARADLVRKSRKLAQLFGQTPEPRALSIDNAESASRRHSSPLSPDQFSFLSQLTADDALSYIDTDDEEEQVITITPEQQAEDERRRKREKLAKLHRFLGSRVPTNLVLGLDDSSAYSLPPDMSNTTDTVKRKVWLKRRRSSSAAVFPSSWDDDLERLKEDLNDQEKALNVRRALKMEKVFGVAPPQTLYHTRHISSASVSAPSLGKQSVPRSERNPNQSAYKPKSTKSSRPGTSESSKHLIPKDEDDVSVHRTSLVYTHYQHSLNSLSDIIDRDDKESLAELHQYLNNDDPPSTPPLQDFTRTKDRPASIASIKSERRHSLPARTSMLSLVSEYSISSPKPEITDFQLRRRRAAKLTQFFGVDYRDLIRDVLDSIENGLEHERKRGTLKPEEADDLLQKLRNLKIKRDGIY